MEPQQPVTDHAVKIWHTMALISALRSLIAINAFPHLKNGSTVPALACATATCPSIIRRLLRVVVEHGLVTFQSTTETYWNTGDSRAYGKGSQSSNFIQMMFDFSLTIDMPGWVSTRGDDDPKKYTLDKHNAFNFTFKREGCSFWNVLGDQPRMLESLHHGLETMECLHPFSGHQYQACVKSAIEHKDDRVLIVDVGGGNGQFLVELLRANLSIDPSRIILQDIPSALDYARSNVNLTESVLLIEHDFFTPQPVRSAHIYHIRACLHNWGDRECIDILSHLREAMDSNSILLVAENVISDVPSQGEDVGAMDILMLGIGGKERTLPGFRKIFHDSGLQLDKVWPSGAGYWTVLQASRVSKATR